VILRTNVTAAYAAEQVNNLKNQLHQQPQNARDEPIISEHYPRERAPMSAKINAYLDWAETAEKHMRLLFADTDLSDGLFGNRYWHIAGLPAASAYGTRIINQEIAHQDARLQEAIETLQRWQTLGERLGDLLALDANVFLQYRPYDEIPWTEITGSPTVRLILTMPVLDEIEAKKQGDNRRLRKRARKILPRIDKAFGDEGVDFFEVQRDSKPMPGVTMEILRDSSGRRRNTTDMDAEFLDRCEFLQQAAGRPVTVVTADTGMKIRAQGHLDGLKRLTLSDKYRLIEDQEGQETGTVTRIEVSGPHGPIMFDLQQSGKTEPVTISPRSETPGAAEPESASHP